MKRCSFREKVSPQDPKEQEQKAGGGKEILGDEISLGHGKEIKIFDIPLTAEIDRIIDQRNHVAHGGIISHTVDGHSQAAEENSLRQDTEEIHRGNRQPHPFKNRTQISSAAARKNRLFKTRIP